MSSYKQPCTDLLLMQKDLKTLRDDTQEIKCDIREMKDHWNGLVERLDNRYASKKVELGFYALIIIFALAALYIIFDRVGLPR